MKISVERENWTRLEPDLVVLVGDPYADYIGAVPDSVGQRIGELSGGFGDGSVTREVQFSSSWGDGVTDFVYYHTSVLKGFTGTETLKTFLSKALHLAAETGRKKVAMLLGGAEGSGITEQLVEGALVGTYSFREYKKDARDRFEGMELVLCLAAPPAVESAPEPEPEAREPEPEPEEVEASEPESEEAPAETSAPAESDSDGEEEAASADEGDGSAEPAEEEGSGAGAGVETLAEEAGDGGEVAAEYVEESPEQPADTAPVVDKEALAELKAADESALAVGRAFADGVNLARTLVARPASECTPDFLAKTCKKLAASHRFSFQSFGPKQLETHGYTGLITVGKGADNNPRMIEMTYTPEGDSDVHLVLLGKGVTFDSGGISIKGADKMHLMIGDMAGAAAVIGAMETLGRLKPGIKVTGLVVSAENKPGSKSYRPGDIIRYKNGISVHVENTDAEGRLILADGLIRAGELGATHIVDLATLTGACARALGPSFTGVMGANRKLVNAITRAGGNHGESYWRLPMPLEYKDMLKSVHADLNNVGGPNAGATTAALFLKEFVPPGVAWVHLDIAGTFWKEKPWKYYSEGPSGTGVKTIADLALRWQEHLG